MITVFGKANLIVEKNTVCGKANLMKSRKEYRMRQSKSYEEQERIPYVAKQRL